jgi:methylase of polypeptide subunit release factors
VFFYRKIAEQAEQILKFGGAVFLEIPHERASEIQNLFGKEKWKTRIESDLNRRQRILVADLK